MWSPLLRLLSVHYCVLLPRAVTSNFVWSFWSLTVGQNLSDNLHYTAPELPSSTKSFCYFFPPDCDCLWEAHSGRCSKTPTCIICVICTHPPLTSCFLPPVQRFVVSGMAETYFAHLFCLFAPDGTKSTRGCGSSTCCIHKICRLLPDWVKEKYRGFITEECCNLHWESPAHILQHHLIVESVVLVWIFSNSVH